LHVDNSPASQATDELKERLQPVNAAVKKILHDREDRLRKSRLQNGKRGPASAQDDGENAETEENLRRAEKESLDKVIAAQGLPTDVGASQSGIYELCGESIERQRRWDPLSP
jgi:hypothetical protein